MIESRIAAPQWFHGTDGSGASSRRVSSATSATIARVKSEKPELRNHATNKHVAPTATLTNPTMLNLTVVRNLPEAVIGRSIATAATGLYCPCSRQAASTKPRSQRCAGSASRRGCHICETVIASVRTGSGKLLTTTGPELA